MEKPNFSQYIEHTMKRAATRLTKPNRRKSPFALLGYVFLVSVRGWLYAFALFVALFWWSHSTHEERQSENEIMRVIQQLTSPIHEVVIPRISDMKANREGVSAPKVPSTKTKNALNEWNND